MATTEWNPVPQDKRRRVAIPDASQTCPDRTQVMTTAMRHDAISLVFFAPKKLSICHSLDYSLICKHFIDDATRSCHEKWIFCGLCFKARPYSPSFPFVFSFFKAFSPWKCSVFIGIHSSLVCYVRSNNARLRVTFNEEFDVLRVNMWYTCTV